LVEDEALKNEKERFCISQRRCFSLPFGAIELIIASTLARSKPCWQSYWPSWTYLPSHFDFALPSGMMPSRGTLRPSYTPVLFPPIKQLICWWNRMMIVCWLACAMGTSSCHTHSCHRKVKYIREVRCGHPSLFKLGSCHAYSSHRASSAVFLSWLNLRSKRSKGGWMKGSLDLFVADIYQTHVPYGIL